jgi:2-methylcitrate dehydratase PrpD
VRLVHDEELERLMPRREAIVDVILDDGKQLSERVGNVRGTAENPMNRDDIVAKARDLMAPVLGNATCQTLIDRIMAIESVKSVVELRPLLQRAG